MYFDIDMGVVTSLTITKGGADSLWTVDGHPQMIEVNMNVVDLYPQMIQIKDIGLLAYNLGIASFLENMAGIRPDQLSFLKFKSLINRKLSNSLLFTTFLDGGSGIKDRVGNKFADFFYELQGKFNNILR
ncbi:hypothetical protein PBI_PBS1_98 [Bacillus phage PBS1]|uniref:Uncharacterized protein n=1 Tax=Bacillus phage PBS1 TaxID=2884423 RepID=A0A223LDS3_BPPB1|nr:virion structural protein [Bacillus phage PBS1]AST99920.1 hypothetical protein PBI_PBS1_98 [Bacillus phage PBS1]QXN70129.1 hypothetical protein INTERNEXUS_88 [Bacillus phage vB_BspM_Internexus]